MFDETTVFSNMREKFIIAARLDAPTQKDCLRMIEDAVAVEKTGLAGRAYFDIGGAYPDGDKWLKMAADAMEQAGFDTSRDTSRELFQSGCRSDSPAVYFGWYSTHPSGRFGEKSLRFEPGAIAAHIHSFSAATLRSDSRHWCGPLLAKGVTLTFGNVAEPYLHLTTRPDIFLAALLRGEQAGEAYAVSTPAWSWQTILIGDPLYRPFKVPLEAQFALLKTRGADAFTPGWRDGVLLRKSNLMRRDTATDSVVEMLAAAVRERPTPALRFALARAAAYPGLAWAGAESVAGADIGLLAEIARLLWNEGRNRDAFRAYEMLLARKDLSAPFRKEILREAATAAKAAGLKELAKSWESER